MNVNVKVPAHVMIRAFYLFFLITSLQFGVGTMGAPRYIFKFAQQDSWVSILIAFAFIILTVAVMFIILNQYENADIFGIQVDVFGNFLGKFLGIIYVSYFGMGLITVIATYIEVVQMFLYPTFPTYVIATLILLLVIYAITGGIRVITGVAFIFFLATQTLLIFLYDPMSRMEWGHFLPMFQASPKELMQGAKATFFTNSGFEMLFLLYPFIENKEKAKLPTFLGIAYSSLILLVLTIVLIGYFSLEHIEDLEWSLLTLFKSVSFTFVERIDYIVIMAWLLIIIPNNVLLLWGMTYGLNRLFNIKQKGSIYVLAGIILLVVSFVKYDYQILKLTDFIAQIGFWIAFIYPFILLPCVLIRKKWKRSKGLDNS